MGVMIVLDYCLSLHGSSMLQTEYGSYNGDTWEDLCQLIFKFKYAEGNYQEMPASPGDFGIEGFIKHNGVAFQCYCPDENYTISELYEHQRDKITADLKKLQTYESDISKRIGDQKIKEWIFLTPIIKDNKLLKHARKKEVELRALGLNILTPNFSVILRDADFYAKEINQVKANLNTKLTFLEPPPNIIEPAATDRAPYEANILRKNLPRCTTNGVVNNTKYDKLNELTLRKWIDGDDLLRRIDSDAPEIFFNLSRTIFQYENELEELCLTWDATPNELISKIRNDLRDRIKESVPTLGDSEIYSIADNMTSKWIALCPIEIEV
jgi:hypothetical protein